jgi:TolA-binding protein
MQKTRDIYRVILGSPLAGSSQDTLGTGNYQNARRLFESGDFDSAAVRFQQFANRFPRNLFVNEALEHVLLIREHRETRDPGFEPLKIYAQAVVCREAGLADSAAALARSGLERYPSARIRYHWRYLLAEIARDQGDHASAIGLALAVADSTSRSRLAPYALKLAGDETLAMGDDPAKALRLYQALLERYPTSPLAPPVRARVLEIRKKLQL